MTVEGNTKRGCQINEAAEVQKTREYRRLKQRGNVKIIGKE